MRLHTNLILSFQTLIKSEPVEEELEPAEKKKKTRARVKNAQLPSELLVRKKFSKIVLPTLFQWAAALKNPWRILPEHIKEAMKIIGRAHAGEDYDPSEDSPEVKSVRLLNRLFAEPVTLIFYRQYNDFVTLGVSNFSIMQPGHSLHFSIVIDKLSVPRTRSGKCGHSGSW